MTELSDEVQDKIEREMTKSYIGGLIDGRGTVGIRVAKVGSYHLGYSLQPRIQLSKTQPFSIQTVDDWAVRNGIYTEVKQTDRGYTLQLNRRRDIARFLQELYPYVQDKMEAFEIMLDDILPAIERGEYRSDEEEFVSIIEDIERLRNQTASKKASKYTPEYFKDEWDL